MPDTAGNPSRDKKPGIATQSRKRGKRSKRSQTVESRLRRSRKQGKTLAWQNLPKYAFWPVVEGRLSSGEPCLSIARWWKSKGQWQHVNTKTLAKYLANYRKFIMDPGQKLDVGPVCVHYIKELASQYSSQIDVFDELIQLINTAKHRLGYVLKKEEPMQFPIEMGTKLVEQLHELVKTYFEWLVRTGRLPQAPQKLEHTFKSGGNGGGADVESEREKAQKQRRIAEMAIAIMSVASKATALEHKTPTTPKKEELEAEGVRNQR